MRIGPSLIYDKSTIQSLSRREARWLHHHYHVVITTIFLIELISNLAKTGSARSTPESAVTLIADKIPSWDFTPNVGYHELITMNLLGYHVEMGRRPILGGGRPIRHPDGTYGIYIDEPPEAKAVRRWQEGDFNGLERIIADQWSRDLQSLDLSIIKNMLRCIKYTALHVKDEESLFFFVDGIVKNSERYRLLQTCLETFSISDDEQKLVITRWKRCGRPPLDVFAPYAAFSLRIELFFVVGIATDLIASTRPKHRSDFAYLYYLPFTRIFTSNDNLHKKYAPVFMAKDQCFVDGTTMKADLKKLADYYDALPEAERSKGSASYASYPPQHGAFLISSIYDRYIPGWRTHAARPNKPMSKEENDKIMEGLRPIIDAIMQDRQRRRL